MFRQKWFISLLCILGFAIPSYAIDGVDEDVADVVSVSTLRYWIDSGTNDMHEQTLENGTSISEVLKQSIDVSDMALGSHTISFQLKGNDEVYSRIYNVSFYIANLTSNDVTETISPVKQIEYWIDNYEQKKSLKFQSEDVHIEENLSHIASGIYTLYYSAFNEAGMQSFGYRNFMIDSEVEEDKEETPKVASLRYWLDGNVLNSEEKVLAEDASLEDALKQDFDVSALPAGCHTISYQLKGSDDIYGVVKDVQFFITDLTSGNDVPDVASQVKQYEYWIGNNPGNKKTFKYENEAIHIEEDLSQYTSGTYTLYCSAITEKGDMGFSYQDFLMSGEASEEVAEDSSLAYCQYWIDGDVVKNMVVTEYSSFDNGPLTIDMANTTPGRHTLYYQFVSANGEWGEILSQDFFIADLTNKETAEVDNSRLVAYRIGIDNHVNEVELGLAAGVQYEKKWSVDMPDLEDIVNIDPAKIAIEGSKATFATTTSSTSFIQFRNEQGEWGEPAFVSEELPYEKSVTVRTSILNHPSYVGELRLGEFEMFKIDIAEDRSYNFSSLNGGMLAYYNSEGKYMDSFSLGTDPNAGINKNAVQGTYYLMLYNQPDNGSFRISNLSKCVSAPIINYDVNTRKVKITSTHEGAKVYYTIDNTEPTSESALYEDEFLADHYMKVMAVAKYEGFADSHIVSLLVNLDKDKCKPVEFNYDGHHLAMQSEKGAEIRYTLDGTEPDATSLEYNGEPITINEITTVKAIATRKDGYKMNSDVSSFMTPSVYDGKIVTVAEAGNLSKAFGWSNNVPVNNELVVRGHLNVEDLKCIQSFNEIVVLDMADASIEGNTLTDKAFAAMPAVLYVKLPKSLTSCGKNIFESCKMLATVSWTADVPMPDGVLDGIGNPNLLLYVTRAELAPNDQKNVVALGRATSITLSNVNDNLVSYGNFYCPESFVAQEISYTRDFSQETAFKEEKGQGWETLVLPFTATSITHATKGTIKPFAAMNKNDVDNDYSEAKPFWLCSSTASDFVDEASVKAGVPYIIAMPNNKVYADRYNLPGMITFSANQAAVEITQDKVADSMLQPNYVYKPHSSEILSLNVYQDEKPGSLFAQNCVDVKPFEAYIPMDKVAVSRLYIADYHSTTGIMDIPLDVHEGLHMWQNNSILYLQADKMVHINIYHVNGMLCKKVLVGKEAIAVSDLPSGVYIVNKKKIVIK